MSPTEYFWYDIAESAVQRAEERPEGAVLGPFASEEEAAEAPNVLMAYAQSWLETEDAQRILAEHDENEDDSSAQ